jgi:hypothetical protein
MDLIVFKISTGEALSLLVSDLNDKSFKLSIKLET